MLLETNGPIANHLLNFGPFPMIPWKSDTWNKRLASFCQLHFLHQAREKGEHPRSSHKLKKKLVGETLTLRQTLAGSKYQQSLKGFANLPPEIKLIIENGEEEKNEK